MQLSNKFIGKRREIFIIILFISFHLLNASSFKLKDVIAVNDFLQGEEPSLQSILNNYYKAVAGSKEKLESIKTLESKGEITFSTTDVKANIVTKYQVPNKYISIVDFMGQKVVQGFDGLKPISNLSALTQDKEKEMREKKGIFTELYFADENSEYLGKSILNGNEVHKIKFKDKDAETLVYFDAKTGLKVKEEILKTGENMVKEYSEYKDFQGIKLATKIKTIVPGQIATQTVDSYTINPVFSDKDFSL